MELNVEILKKMARAIATTTDKEIGCDDCFEFVDIFVESQLQGKNPAEAMPLVEAHLNRCANCHEEFEALLVAIKATTDNNH
ncbi:MAG: hypothetical protein ISR58_13070 [Anaerolineales bacterium]|nr:hypothetical protein [Chloroflexota bacterium]MBL6982108.1 hypothetical protein [Anaerolineales bacterium]